MQAKGEALQEKQQMQAKGEAEHALRGFFHKIVDLNKGERCYWGEMVIILSAGERDAELAVTLKRFFTPL